MLKTGRTELWLIALATVLVVGTASAAVAQRDEVPGQQARNGHVAVSPAVADVAQPDSRTLVKAPPQELQPFIIGAADVLQVNVWREPEISQKLVVRPDGKISLPLIGDIEAAGQAPQDLAGIIRDKLKTYLTAPVVTVIVAEIHSKSFVVTGEVSRPGTYPLTRAMTVLEAITQAGGFRDFAKKNRIYVLRNEGGIAKRSRFDYEKVISGRAVSTNIEVKHGDTIVVP